MAVTHPPATTPDDFHALLELSAEIGRDFVGSLDLANTLDKGLARIAGYLDAEAASLFMLEDADRVLVCRACYGPIDIAGLRLGAAQGIVGRAVQENVCQIVRDVGLEPDFSKNVDEGSGFRARSILCAPLSVNSRCVGAVELLNKKSGDGLFSEHERRVLQALASFAALAIINARMTAAVIEQELDQRERDWEAEIQRNMLPKPRGPEFPATGVNVPARGGSRNFYDFFELDGGRIGFSVGEVPGKGMNSAFLMAKTISLYRCLARSERPPDALLATVNKEICETSTQGMFVTMVGGVYDPATDTVTFANAGHEPPLLRTQRGDFQRFPASAPPLGIASDLLGPRQLVLENVPLNGGSFVVFTDTITESLVSDEGGVGPSGLQHLLNELADLPPQERLSAIAATLDRPGAALRDDLTVLIIERRTGSNAKAVSQCHLAQDLFDGVFEGEPLVRLRCRASPEELKRVRQAVREAALAVGCTEPCVRDAVIAVDEACQNVVRHAYGGACSGEFLLDVRRHGERLVFNLVDYAPPVDVSRVKPRALDHLRPGGLGTHFIHECMDEVTFRPPPQGAGNWLQMVRRIG